MQQHISRGKVDVFVTVDSSMADDMTVRINEPLLRGYLEAIEHIAEEHKLPNDATAMSVSRFPDVLSVEKKGGGRGGDIRRHLRRRGAGAVRF